MLSGLPMQVMALEVTTSLKTPWHDFKISNSWAIRFMSHKRLALHEATTLTLETMISYLWYIIHLHQQHDYFLEEMSNVYETPVFFNMPTNTMMGNDQNQYVSKQQDMKN
jgi:EamA domain-containing membrane protein RarD